MFLRTPMAFFPVVDFYFELQIQETILHFVKVRYKEARISY